MSVAQFIYEDILCRYLTPDESLVNDRGPEFTNKVVKSLLKEYGVKNVVISPARPQANGQAEAAVKSIKQRLKAMLAERSEPSPADWDGTMFHSVLQAIRMEPHSAHKVSPCELLIARRPKYPFEVSKIKANMQGCVATKAAIKMLEKIRKKTFGIADENIKEHQRRMKKNYDRRNKVVTIKLKKGDKVQARKYRTKKAKGGSFDLVWYPHDSFYKVHSINKKHNIVFLYSPKLQRVLKNPFSLSRIRKFNTI